MTQSSTPIPVQEERDGVDRGDPFEGLDPNTFVEPRFVPVDRARLPLLSLLTRRYRQVEESIAALQPVHDHLERDKQMLLDDAFSCKYSEPRRPGNAFDQLDQRSWDWSIAWFRRNPYQRTYREYELVIANLAEDAHELLVCINDVIDSLPQMTSRSIRDLAMLNAQSANRLLFIAQERHSKAVKHLGAQPNQPAGLPAQPLHDAISRLRRDIDAKYWIDQRRCPAEFPVTDTNTGVIRP